MTSDRKVVLVVRKTRLQDLLVRHQTVAQARFHVERLGADFSDYEREHAAYEAARQLAVKVLERHGRYQVVDRAFLPNFLFGPDDLVLALGQDGLVANTMKYLDGNPLAGLNPEPARYDGVLLPFVAADLGRLLPDLLADRRPFRAITMAQATLSDKQVLHAVNDLFIGPKSHTSARYEIHHRERSETQSSSGIVVSTGLGSTAWMRSILTGSAAIAERKLEYPPMRWDADYLQFAVREPFPSRMSQAELAFGEIRQAEELAVRSLMPEHGVIFSDGIEADYLEFNSGTEARIRVASRQGMLVV